MCNCCATNRCLPVQLNLQHITGHPDKLRLLRLLGFHSPPNPCIAYHGAGLLTATIAAATDSLTGYETTNCIDALSGSSMDEQRQINAFLHSGDCASPGFQLLDEHKRGKSPDRCPLLVALQLTCTGDSDVWTSNTRAAHVLAEGFVSLQQRLETDAQYFVTDLDADRLARIETWAKLSHPHPDDAERRHTENLHLALQYRMLRKQLHQAVSGVIDKRRRELPSTDLPSLDERVNQLNDWLATVGCAKNVIKASVDPDYRVKAVATKPIREGEVYLSVPVSAIMDSDTANSDPQFGESVLSSTLMRIAYLVAPRLCRCDGQAPCQLICKSSLGGEMAITSSCSSFCTSTLSAARSLDGGPICRCCRLLTSS